ncbi:MAG TPA: succinate dehydrogenase, cytochrome b556 subunit [Steroidobacteraceae bacterium]|jgi:succinate dehydrogenase / fumarate reductase cytochrome b subunit|nr:succinate dehydrogenase, cytochrome b556 subunit [Steroidobacteraceae bacterium]
MAQPQRPLSPFMQYRWQYTNTTSILHRITGILLSLCFFVLVYWLAAAAAGADRYRAALEAIASPLVQLVLFAGLFSFCYHLLNGIRHLFFDAGYGFELPVARKTGWAAVIGAVVLTAVLWVTLGAMLGGAA